MIIPYFVFLFALLLYSTLLGLAVIPIISICSLGLLFSVVHLSFFRKHLSFANIFASVSIFLFCFTMPNLYFISDNWWLASVKVVDFSFPSVLSLSLRFLACLFLFVFICKFHSLIYLKYMRSIFEPYFKRLLNTLHSFLHKILTLASSPFVLLLFCVFVSLTRILAFSLSIGITGLDPTPLPFKLTGIIVFFLSLSPLLYSYFLLRTNNVICIIAIFSSSLLNSVLGASKLQLFLPVVAFLLKLFIDLVFSKKRTLKIINFVITIFLAIFILTFVNSVKSNLALSDSYGNRYRTSLDSAISNAFFDLEDSSISFITHTSLSFFTRFDSIENIFIASTYNPYNVSDGQPVNRLVIPILRSLYRPDADDHHVEWIGQPYIYGFYLGGGFLSELFILFQNSPLFFVLISNIVGFIFVVVSTIAYSLKLPRLYFTALCTVFSLVVIADIGGVWFYFSLLLLPILAQSLHFSTRRFISK